jgi:FtsZ-binding cell division protein ZapB
MTDGQTKTLRDFERKVRRIIDLYSELKLKYSELNGEVVVQRAKIEALTEENVRLKSQYESLKIARFLEVKQGDFAIAKERIDRLVNEINDCIRLING